MTSRRQPDDSMDPLLRAAARQADDAGTGGVRPEAAPHAHASRGACLGPDVIASWAEGRLGRDDTAALEGHAASCARCRAVLAAFAQTTPAAPLAAPWWKAPVLRWAAPLAAVAGATIIWVAVENTIEPDKGAPRDTSMSAGSAVPERDPGQQPPGAPEAPPPAVAAEAERPGERAQEDRARTKATGAPAPRTIDSVRVEAGSPAVTSPPDAAPPPIAGAPRAVAAEPLAALQDTVLLRTAGPLEVKTPDPRILWRLRPGLAERSDDGGASWTARPLPGPGEALAGTCPAVNVCWLAGTGGAVLRTVDGQVWTRTTAPDPADLAAITATDSLNAAVTTVDGRAFVTSDGGQTWSRRPVQEPPVAPF